MEVRLFGLVAIGAALLVPSVAFAADPTPTPPTETPVVTPEPTPPAETPPAETPPAETPPAETPPAETPPAEAAPAPAPPAGGISLGADIRLHARFDVSYERHTYTDNPSDGKDALRVNHKFVFLTRHSKSDPFFFNAEILGLNFYEAGYRLRPSDLEEPWRFAVSAGKVLVPFGAEPLYHHAYGGRVGGDQRFVPVMWADLGVKATFNLDFEPVHLRFDAYAVNGLALPNDKPETRLNIAGHASPLGDLNLAGGGRISASWGPLNLYYSVYGSALNFGKTVLMQGLDISLFRLHGVPFLEDLAISAGVVRADVWGGGEPAYYHFSDYIEVRYYPIGTLFIQYRGGLDMRDNRSGVFADGARLDKNDTSGHSVGIGWQIHGLTLLAQHHWQLELADEQPDDFFRITATYEF